MHILVITRSAWRNDNNTGNTLSALFSGIDAEFFGLCFRDEEPENSFTKSNFAISEGQIIANLKDRKNVVGKENFISVEASSRESEIYSAAKNAGAVYFVILKFAREILWSLGTYKTESLTQYIKKVNPDIIFMPVFNCYYPHKVLRYIHTLTDAKIILFHADDNYSLKKFSFNPLYWLYRFGLRRNIRKSVSISDKNYVISALQKSEYEKAFKRECKILTKSANFDKNINLDKKENDQLEIVYTGNLSVGRWKTLALINDALKNINKDKKVAVMKVYSYSKLKSEQMNMLADGENTVFMGGVKPEMIADIQRNADILVYPESFSLKERLEVRQSFSTKIVDYLSSANPIFAVGPRSIASINYFLENDSAEVATTKSEIEEKLKGLIDSKELRNEYAKKAYECGKKNHNATVLKNEFIKDLKSVLNKDD